MSDPYSIKQIVKSRLLAGKPANILFTILFATVLTSSRAQDTWLQKTNFGGEARYAAVGFSIGSKGYVGTGSFNGDWKNDFWEYDPAANVWTQKADFGGGGRQFAAGFSIGSKGYIGTGMDITYSLKNDFWEYDPDSNTWTQKAGFGGTGRSGAVGFSIGSKGYIGTGGGYTNDFWEYDPAVNSWTQKASFGGTGRKFAVGFSIGNKGYIGTGYDADGFNKNDFWEYDPDTNGWTQKASFGGKPTSVATGFSIGTKGYIGTGYAQSSTNDFWEYDPAINGWTQKANFGGTARTEAVGFSIGSKGYIGTGFGPGYNNDFWEYTPDSSSCAVPSNLSVPNITSSSAQVKWAAVAGAYGYKVRFKVSGTGEWTELFTIGKSKTLTNLSPNTKYTWEVKTRCTIAPGTGSEWSSKQHFTTASLRVGDESFQQVSFQIYPNPVEDHATIQFTLAKSSHVCIKVYDVSGKEIGELLDAELQQGEHSIQINTNHFSKGVYTVRMISDFGIENQKLIVQ